MTNKNCMEKTSSKPFLLQKHVIRQIWVSGLANLLQTMQGFVVAMSSIMIPQLLHTKNENELYLTEDEATWFASIYCFGYLLGSFIGAFQGNYFGQRISLIIDCITATTGLLVVGLAPSFPYLCIGRLLCGHACASATVTIPIYTSEISLPKVRGITGSFFLNFYLGGYCLTVILGSAVHWRITIVSLVIFPIFSAIFLSMAPNSPIWLLQKGRDEEAFKSLLYFRDDILEVREEIAAIAENLVISKKKNKNMESNSLSDRFRFKLNRLKSPEFVKPLMISIILTAGFVEWNGLGAISFYMVNFIKEVKIPVDPYLGACINTIGRAAFGILSTGWISKYPRRYVFLTSIAVMIQGTLMISVYHYLLTNDYFVKYGLEENLIIPWIPAIGYLLTSYSFCSGYIQISYMCQGELLPSDVKSFGSGIVGFVDGLSMFVSAKTALTLLNSLGVVLYFAYCTVALSVCFIFAFFLLPETKGKTLQEIENGFRK
ncbi:facilitated trehalose transporter Tret1 [Lepeophtheirus salmonis]|uniref:facilitated trehalose transporter Tret1 n=1 Tax=Lepeophtheirus salmonis TaxID=72036 RepID=UPI001AE4C71A|nr:facilitated trehalose transporter Tret1-like [Lepeophtheirus salmonis]